jgi:hypothetical protein
MEAAIRGVAALDFRDAASAPGAVRPASTSTNAGARRQARRSSIHRSSLKLPTDLERAKTSPA